MVPDIFDESNKELEMIGSIIVTGIGALSFKLGMDAQRMKAEGKNTAEIVACLPKEAYNTVAGAARWCYEAVRKMAPRADGETADGRRKT